MLGTSISSCADKESAEVPVFHNVRDIDTGPRWFWLCAVVGEWEDDSLPRGCHSLERAGARRPLERPLIGGSADLRISPLRYSEVDIGLYLEEDAMGGSVTKTLESWVPVAWIGIRRGLRRGQNNMSRHWLPNSGHSP